jgi:hypothetical protein
MSMDEFSGNANAPRLPTFKHTLNLEFQNTQIKHFPKSATQSWVFNNEET